MYICEDCPLPHIVEKTGKCFDCLGNEEPLEDEVIETQPIMKEFI